MPDSERSSVPVPPPVIVVVSIGVGIGLDQAWPIDFIPEIAQYAVGGAVALASFALFGWTLGAFARAKTSIDHRKPTARIISTGPFGLSRNPVYVSMVMLQLGIGVLVDSIAVFAMAVLTTVVLQRFVILREEAFLRRKFSAEYDQYTTRVRRWL